MDPSYTPRAPVPANVRDLIARVPRDGLQPVVDALNKDYILPAVTRYNSEVGPRQFGRIRTEKVPTAPRRLTEFRGRIGSLIEFALGNTLDDMFRDEHGFELRLSFVVTQTFPDFHVRDGGGVVVLRIDCKLLHDESVEYSARFETLTKDVDPSRDLLLYVAWQWREIDFGSGRVTYPHILEALVLPVADIASERDLRQELAGGRFARDGRPQVRAKPRPGKRGRPKEWSTDTNWGKIDRIVHTTRRTRRDQLSPNIIRFLEFIDRHATVVKRTLRAPPPRRTPDEVVPPRAPAPPRARERGR